MSAEGTSWGDAGRGGRRSRGGAMAWVLRSLKVGALALLLVSAGYAAYCGVIIYAGNFHVVEAGVLYRSAQPDRAELDSYARDYGVKSVLNLRGAHPGAPWYDAEVAAAHALGLAHYDYPISAKRFVSAGQIAQILDIVRRAPKPLLIHCQSGADRAGLVAALFDYVVARQGAAQADRQLSLLYGHFPYLTSRSGAMDDSFWAFVRAPQTAGN